MSSSSNIEQADALLKLVARAERLEALPRTGWKVCGVERPESIAAHSYGVTLIAMWLADHVDVELDTERVLRIALVHDLAEAMLTDLPRPVKEMLGASAWRDAEDQATAKLFASGLDSWRRAHDEYREADTTEAQLVKAADRIQMLVKALQYRAENRGRVNRFFENRQDLDDYGIPLLAAVYERLFEYVDEESWFAAGFD